MTQNFAGWLWHSLTMSTKTRSEKENKIGMFLLFSGIVWLVIPLSPIRLMLQFAQLLLGAVLMAHGLYLKSVESAEEKRKWKASERRRYKEANEQLREMIIKRIAEADGISLEEAGKKADETEWLGSDGKVIPPPWMRETEEAN